MVREGFPSIIIRHRIIDRTGIPQLLQHMPDRLHSDTPAGCATKNLADVMHPEWQDKFRMPTHVSSAIVIHVPVPQKSAM